MSTICRHVVGAGAAVCLNACTSLNLIHDPETGIISRDQVPGFLKSVRCEIATFYQVNYQLRRIFLKNMDLADQFTKKASADPRDREVLLQKAAEARQDGIVRGSSFPVSPELFGGVFLDLKVLDTLGIGTGDTNLANKSGRDASHTVTWSAAPTFNTQNTYEMNFSFLIDQRSASLLNEGPEDSFRCYTANPPPYISSVDLAQDKVAGAAQFTRILVNGTVPLAAWLIENSSQAWQNFHAAHADAERAALIPVQMNYSFTVQVTGGLDVRYSLASPIWSPAQVGGAVSSVQTSQMSIYINGDDANLAGGVKLGQAVNGVAKSDGSAPGVPYVGEPDIGRSKKEVDSQIASLEGKLKDFDTKSASPDFTGPPSVSRGDIQAQLDALKRIRRNLNQAGAAPILREVSSGVPAGNKRGYLNAPVGIAPPP